MILIVETIRKKASACARQRGRFLRVNGAVRDLKVSKDEYLWTRVDSPLYTSPK